MPRAITKAEDRQTEAAIRAEAEGRTSIGFRIIGTTVTHESPITDMTVVAGAVAIITAEVDITATVEATTVDAIMEEDIGEEDGEEVFGAIPTSTSFTLDPADSGTATLEVVSASPSVCHGPDITTFTT